MQQILRWLFKVAHEQGGHTTKDQEDGPKDIVFSTKQRRSKSKKFKALIFPCYRDVARACFYSTIYSSRVRTSRDERRRHWARSMNTKKEDIATGFVVSPTPRLALSSSSIGKDDRCNAVEKKDKIKGDSKTKTMSRMKELLRWAAATKSEKLGGKFIGRKVLLFRNRGALKAVPSDDDQFSYESPKISFRWDVDSCSTMTSSALSRISVTSSMRNNQTYNMASLDSSPIHGLTRCSSRRGNWITTDSEFVVLEL